MKNVKPSLCFCRLSLSVSLGFLLISFGSFHVYLALLLAFFVFDCFFFGSPVTGPRKLQKGRLECHKSVLLSASRPQSHPQVNPHSRRATFPCGLSITPPALPNSAGATTFHSAYPLSCQEILERSLSRSHLCF